MKSKRTILVVIIAALITIFFVFDLQQYLTLESLKNNQQVLAEYINKNWFVAFIGYLVIYTIAAALSVPGAVVLTLGAGALFGFGWGLLLVSFASSIGATLAFLASRLPSACSIAPSGACRRPEAMPGPKFANAPARR